MGRSKVILKTCPACGIEKELRAGFIERRKEKCWSDTCRACQPKRQQARRDYETAMEGMMTVSVPCRGCGYPVKILIEEGTKPPPKFCSNCLDRDYVRETADTGEVQRVVRQTAEAYGGHGAVKTYRPGDAEFHAMAQQYQR